MVGSRDPLQQTANYILPDLRRRFHTCTESQPVASTHGPHCASMRARSLGGWCCERFLVRLHQMPMPFELSQMAPSTRPSNRPMRQASRLEVGALGSTCAAPSSLCLICCMPSSVLSIPCDTVCPVACAVLSATSRAAEVLSSNSDRAFSPNPLDVVSGMSSLLSSRSLLVAVPCISRALHEHIVRTRENS